MLVNVPHSAVQQASSRPFVLHTLFRELTRRASNRYRLDPLNKSERRVHEGGLLGARLIWTRLTPIDVTEMVCAVDRQLLQIILPATSAASTGAKSESVE